MSEYLVLDIETAPLENAADYTDLIGIDKRLKDPEKIAEAKAKLVDGFALDLDLCRVVAIGFGMGESDPIFFLSQDQEQEREALIKFWRIAADRTMVGKNLLGFDLPVLIQRSRYLNVTAPDVNIDKYRSPHLDLQEILTFRGKFKWRSLGFYCKRFGIPHDDTVSGKNIPGLVAAGEWDKVAAHATDDVRATAALARRIGVMP